MKLLRAGVAVLALIVCTATCAAAQQVIYLVRHAERVDSAPAAGQAMTAPATDPPLSDAGHARASLARSAGHVIAAAPRPTRGKPHLRRSLTVPRRLGQLEGR